MRAVQYDGAGGVEVISVSEVSDPSPATGQVLIDVAAAGLNRADVMQRLGVYPPPEDVTDVPGLEVSGRVIAVGPDSGTEAEKLLGTDVVALLAGGGCAEQVVADARHVLPVPDGVDVVEAAGLIEVAVTVHSNLIGEAGVRPGDTVLVHGGTGGIGSFALQMLSALDVRVITTVGGPEKIEVARGLGAEHVIDHRAEDFAERVREITDGQGVDAILDVVGAKYLTDNLRSLADDGRLVVIGLQGGRRAEADLGRMLAKRLRIIATTLRSRDAETKARLVAAAYQDIWPRITAGEIRVPVDATFPLADAAQAYAHFDSGTHIGKVLITP